MRDPDFDLDLVGLIYDAIPATAIAFLAGAAIVAVLFALWRPAIERLLGGVIALAAALLTEYLGHLRIPVTLALLLLAAVLFAYAGA